MDNNRKLSAIVFLFVGLVTSCSIVLIPPLDDKLVQIGIGLGTLLGISTCIIYELKNIRLIGDSTIESNSNRDRWKGLAVIGGVILATVIGAQFGEDVQNFFIGLVFSWLIIFSFYVVYWVWKHKTT